jgi:CBS domain-containing protein
MADFIARLRGPVREAMHQGCVVGRSDEPIIGVVARMRAAGVVEAIVVDTEGSLVGVLRPEDFVDRIAFQLEPDVPVAATQPRHAPVCRAEDSLLQALALLQHHRGNVLIVVDASGRPTGLLRLEDIVRVAFAPLISPLTQAAAPEGDIGAAKLAQTDLAAALLAEKHPIQGVLGILNDLNRDIMRRAIENALAQLADDGWGEPPVPFTVLVMGSAGRGESLMHPDQDNGFILADHPDAEHGRIDAYFMELARRFTAMLDAAGFSYCKGNVMATNPTWRKTLPQWQAQVGSWVRARSNAAILSADIFFDFRDIYGPLSLAGTLREHVTAIVQGNLPFLRQLSWNQIEKVVPVGLFGRLIPEGGNGGEAYVDLKLRGTMPLVQMVRILALQHGIPATATLERLAALRQAGVISSDDEATLGAVFGLMVGVLLREQVADATAGRPVGTLVAPRRLGRSERRQLVEAFRDLERIRTRLFRDFTVPIG